MKRVAVTGGVDTLIGNKLNASIIDNPQKKPQPFITIPLTKKCPFRCLYCSEGGELTISNSMEFEWEWFKKVVDISKAFGIEKFRFTGGEPLTYKYIDKCIKYVLDSGAMLLINTNGLYANRLIDVHHHNTHNLHVAISLDSVNEDMFNKISSTRGNFTKVMTTISLLKRKGMLLRINMVVTTLNVHEVSVMIDFCLSEKINLKLQEVVCVPAPFGNWNNLHVPLESLDNHLCKRADEVLIHSYSRSYGIPVKVYRIGDIFVTNKSLFGGSHYDTNGICKICPHYPCHEGLYDLYVLPDHQIATCRWHTITDTDFSSALNKGREIFMRSRYVKRRITQMKSSEIK